MKILICINNRILAEGLRNLIHDRLRTLVVEHRFDCVVSGEPDIVLFESPQDVISLREQFPEARLICLDSGLRDPELACLLYCHGIHGIVSPDLDVDMFCKALRTVHAGELWIEQKHLRAVLRGEKTMSHLGGLQGLSDQDREIVRMVACGLKNRQIAERLFLSEPTVKAHLSRIYRLLKVPNRSSLVALATENGWSVPYP